MRLIPTLPASEQTAPQGICEQFTNSLCSKKVQKIAQFIFFVGTFALSISKLHIPTNLRLGMLGIGFCGMFGSLLHLCSSNLRDWNWEVIAFAGILAGGGGALSGMLHSSVPIITGVAAATGILAYTSSPHESASSLDQEREPSRIKLLRR